MKHLRLQLRRIGPHFRTVLIRGEAGTGKKLVARVLHSLSRAAEDPLVRCDAATLEEALAKCAGRGALFLDAIDRMPLTTQGRLLHVLEENVSAQIIASTNEDLKALVSTGHFRPMLYQRLAPLEIALPPLRERMEDLPELARYFLETFASLHREDPRRIADESIEQMQRYHWPGNVRELKDVLYECVLQTTSQLLEAHHLPVFAEAVQTTAEARSVRLQDVVEQHVLQVLKDCGGNKLRAAEMLGISRSTLYRMLGGGGYAANLH
jgi:DNA-binding NtrC family response regulator